MNRLRIILLPLLLLSLTSLPIKQAASANEIPSKVESKQLDSRAKILSDYFAKYDSPLQYQAQDFIDAADKYGVDWKLVPSIAGVESTFGKRAYGFNAWGWGIYGNQALGFNSWRDGIFTVTGGLKENYINKGLTNPNSINRVYAASPTWGFRVNYFMKDLDKFASQNGVEPKTRAKPQPKVAVPSAKLASKFTN